MYIKTVCYQLFYLFLYEYIVRVSNNRCLVGGSIPVNYKRINLIHSPHRVNLIITIQNILQLTVYNYMQ